MLPAAPIAIMNSKLMRKRDAGCAEHPVRDVHVGRQAQKTAAVGRSGAARLAGKLVCLHDAFTRSLPHPTCRRSAEASPLKAPLRALEPDKPRSSAC